MFQWPTNDPVSGFGNPAWNFSVDGFDNPSSFAELFTVGRVLTVASGDSTHGLLWESYFYGDKALQEFDLTAFAYNTHPWDGSFQRAVAHWDGTAWDFETVHGGATWEEYVAAGGTGHGNIVPAPSAAILGIVGFASVGLIRRRIPA
jgi:hypothetical protein